MNCLKFDFFFRNNPYAPLHARHSTGSCEPFPHARHQATTAIQCRNRAVVRIWIRKADLHNTPYAAWLLRKSRPSALLNIIQSAARQVLLGFGAFCERVAQLVLLAIANTFAVVLGCGRRRLPLPAPYTHSSSTHAHTNHRSPVGASSCQTVRSLGWWQRGSC